MSLLGHFQTLEIKSTKSVFECKAEKILIEWLTYEPKLSVKYTFHTQFFFA